MKNITIAIVTALALVAVIPSANANIASKEYVDDQVTEIYDEMDYTTFGTNNPTQTDVNKINKGGVIGYIESGLSGKMNTTTIDSTPTQSSTNLVSSGGVYNAVDNAVGSEQGSDRKNGILKTDEYGGVSVYTSGAITDSDVRNNAAIQLGKMLFPKPPADCDTYGCMLMRYNGKYVWELVAREENETISDAGGVNVTPSTGERGNVRALTATGADSHAILQ